MTSRLEQALDYAIKASLECDYDDSGRAKPNVDKLIESAKKIEAYLKGEENERT
jgi:hypothetical protein